MLEGEHGTSQPVNLAGLSQCKHDIVPEIGELGELVKWAQLIFPPPL